MGRLPLSVVRQATDRAIDDFATSERQLVILELAHHKNVALLAADSRLSTLVDFVFICDAPLETLLARNSARKYPVPDYYIYLCKRSVCELRRHGCPTFVSFIDTGKQSSRQAAIQLLEHLDEADAPANVKDGSP